MDPHKDARKAGRLVWLLPLCAALYWGACFDPFVSNLRQQERDLRAALCALCFGVAALIVVAATRDTLR